MGPSDRRGAGVCFAMLAAAAFVSVPAVRGQAGEIITWGQQVTVSESDLADLVAIFVGSGHNLGLKPDGSIVAADRRTGWRLAAAWTPATSATNCGSYEKPARRPGNSSNAVLPAWAGGCGEPSS
jgi:hypothetical protein